MRLILIILIFFIKAEAQTSALQVADSLFQYGKYNQAITYYSKVEDKAEVLQKIAKSYIALGIYHNAIKSYEEALKLDANNQLIGFELAKLYASTKNYEKAKTQFLGLIDLDYKNPNYHYNLGVFYSLRVR